VDVCRQAIVLESVPALLACLRAVSRDPDVALCRVKNHLDLASDGRSTAGCVGGPADTPINCIHPLSVFAH
jgi:hypothetical protein